MFGSINLCGGITMSNIAIFKPNQTPQYLKSVNTPDYEGDLNVIINPDISAVEKVGLKYWKRSGNKVVEMTAGEKQAIDLAEKTARIAQIESYGFESGQLAEALVDAGLITKVKIVNFIKGKEGL